MNLSSQRILTIFSTVLLLLSLSSLRVDAAQAPENFPATEKINHILKDARLNGAITGISIRKAENGNIIYSSHGDLRLHPASNMKLLTAIVALETLGSDYQFSTEVWTDGRIKGNVLYGNLYLKGKGDPTLMKKDLNHFAAELRAKGIKKIKGDLIGDDNWYDKIRLSQDLNWSDEPYHTGAQISALTLSPSNDYDAGTVLLEITPNNKNGRKAHIKLSPNTDYVSIINDTTTIEANKPSKVTIDRVHGTNSITVKGVITQNSSTVRKWASVWEPTEYVLHVFKKSLEAHGITFADHSSILPGNTPKNSVRLAAKKSMPLKELLIPFMKLSNNGHAEVLVKEMGKVVYHEGSWEHGLRVIKETLTSLGLNGETIQLRDGSGMSHKNMIPANELTKLLYIVQSKSWFPAFESSLPVAGQPDKLSGGTLRNRLKQELTIGNVQAKTGSISGVSTLSGYITAKNGETYIFSIMINNFLAPSVLDIEDHIVKLIAEG